MHSALAILWMVPSLVFGVGTIITVLALRRAPEGYEDETGFHYTAPQSGTTDRADAAHALPTSGMGLV